MWWESISKQVKNEIWSLKNITPASRSDTGSALGHGKCSAHNWQLFNGYTGTSCYDPEPLPQFSAIFHHFISHSRSLVPHSLPHAPLGPSPNHLTSHLMDHLTNPQSFITCHHSAVRSTPQHHCFSSFWLPAHDAPLRSCQLMMELYLELPRHDFTLVIFPYFSVTSVTRYFSNVYKCSYF